MGAIKTKKKDKDKEKDKEKAERENVDNLNDRILMDELEFSVDERVPSQIPIRQLQINRLDMAGCAPIHWAVKFGDIHKVQVLIKTRADVNMVDIQLKAPLQIALEKGHMMVARLLVENGAETTEEMVNQVPTRESFLQNCKSSVDKILKEAVDRKFDELDLSFSYLSSMNVDALTNITKLCLSYNNFVAVPEFVFALKHLSVLDLSFNLLTEISGSITKLESLTDLILANNFIMDLPETASSLDNLKELDLSVNEFVAVPKSVVALQALTHLNLSQNFLKEVPPELANMLSIEKLDLSDNYISSLQESPIECLPHLSSLNIEGNRLVSLRFYELLQSKALVDFRFEHNRFPTDIKRILKCYFQNQTSLDLSDLGLTALRREITLLTNLRSLSLRNNNFAQLPQQIEKLTTLTSLDLSYLKIVDLPIFLYRLNNLEFLDLEETKKYLESPSPKIIAGGLPEIRGHFKDMLTGEPCQRLKLMMVGQENVGKSTLLHALRNCKLKKRVKRPNISTDGIDIADWEVQKGKQSILFSAWDFAGQEIYYNTHSFFISSKAIYILLWDMRYNDDQSRVEFWLNSIASRAKKAPCILVGTHLDDPMFEGNMEKVEQILTEVDSRYSKRFPNIKGITAVSCVSYAGVENLMDILFDTAISTPYVQERMPQIYYRLENTIKQKREVIIPPALTWSDYFGKIAMEAGLRDEVQLIRATHFLNDLGSLVFFEDEETHERLIVIDPQWLTIMFASVITTKHKIVRQGVLYDKDLTQIWRPPAYPAHLHRQLIALLKQFEILYEMKPDEEGIFYLLPGFLTEEKPRIDTVWRDFEEDTSEYARFYTLQFIPNGLFSRLMVRIMHFTDQPLKYWKTGLITQRKLDKAYIELNGNTIKVFTRGIGAAELLRVTTEIMDSLIKDWFKVELESVMVPCPHCVLKKLPLDQVYLFNLQDLEEAAAKGDTRFVECKGSGPLTPGRETDEPIHVRLDHVVPDIAMADFQGSVVQYSDISIEKKLGKGSFGIIYKGEYRGQTVAVKRLKVDEDMAVAAFAEFRREVWLMSALNHPCITNLIGYSLKPLCMVMECVSGGDLFGYLHDTKCPLDWQIRYKIAIDMARGMMFLHSISPPLLHRDLKSPNVLVTTKSPEPGCKVIAKIADFGLSSRMFVERFQNRAVENPTWCAPEVMKKQPYTEKADVYSFGVMMWELITRELPFAEYTFQHKVEDDVLAGIRPPIPENCLPGFAELTKRCWDGDPNNRPAFEEIVAILQEQIAHEFGNSFKYIIDPSTDKNRKVSINKQTVESGKDTKLTKSLKQHIEYHKAGIHGNTLLKVDNEVWCGLSNGNIAIYNYESGKFLYSLESLRDQSQITHFIRYGPSVCVAGSNGTLSICNIKELAKLMEQTQLNANSSGMTGSLAWENAPKERKGTIKGVVGMAGSLTGTKKSKVKLYDAVVDNGNMKLKRSEKMVLDISLQQFTFNSLPNGRFELKGADGHHIFQAKNETEANNWGQAIKAAQGSNMTQPSCVVEINKTVVPSEDTRINCLFRLEDLIFVGYNSLNILGYDSLLRKRENILVRLPKARAGDPETAVVNSMTNAGDFMWVAVGTFLVRLNPQKSYEQHDVYGPCPSIVRQLVLHSSNNKETVITLLDDGKIGAWNALRPKLPSTWKQISANISKDCRFYCMSICAGNTLWIGSDSQIHILDCDSLDLKATLPSVGPTCAIIPVANTVWTCANNISVWL